MSYQPPPKDSDLTVLLCSLGMGNSFSFPDDSDVPPRISVTASPFEKRTLEWRDDSTMPHLGTQPFVPNPPAKPHRQVPNKGVLTVAIGLEITTGIFKILKIEIWKMGKGKPRSHVTCSESLGH